MKFYPHSTTASPVLRAGLLAAALFAPALIAQHLPAANPSSFSSAFYGSVPVVTAWDRTGIGTERLTLDDAIKLGLRQNLGLREAQNQERAALGLKQESLQALVPTVTAEAGYSHREFDLPSQFGFRHGLLAQIHSVFPLLNLASFPKRTDARVLTGDVRVHQDIFSLSALDAWHVAGFDARSAYFQKMSARGEVVQRVATAYLAVIADQQHLAEAEALEKADHLLLDQTSERHKAGVVANLDELRARVQEQSQQQVVIAAQNSLAKDEILLKREIGLAPGEPMVLLDAQPYSELATFTAEEGLETALKNRQDWQSLGCQLEAAEATRTAIRHQRLPKLSFNGEYGVTAVQHGVDHGTMAAFTTLSVPVFNEASQQGEQQVASANLDALRLQQSDLKTQMDMQIRDALLDVAATEELVKVAQSNVELATRALNDTMERYKAGIDDNLPVVDAQASLADAEARRVDTLYQYNLAKLQLARTTGVLESQYRSFLGR